MDDNFRDSPHSGRRLSELDIVYNPAMGAYLIWRACRGYFSQEGKALPLPFAFLVLPVALHRQSSSMAASTRDASGLTAFATKLGAYQEDLLALHERALMLRELTLASIVAASMAEMIQVAPASAELIAFDTKPTPGAAMVKLGAMCEKFGGWLARLPAEQVSFTLRVSF